MTWDDMGRLLAERNERGFTTTYEVDGRAAGAGRLVGGGRTPFGADPAPTVDLCDLS